MCHVLSHHIKRFLEYEVIMFLKYRDSQTESHTDKTMSSLNIIGSFDVFNHCPKFENFQKPKLCTLSMSSLRKEVVSVTCATPYNRPTNKKSMQKMKS